MRTDTSPVPPVSEAPLRWESYFNAREILQATAPPGDDLHARLLDLGSRIDDLLVGQRASDEQITSIKQAFIKAAEAGVNLTAKIHLPPSERMVVPLVVAHELDRLEEHHSDETRAWALLGIMAGGVFGWITSFDFSTIPPRATLILLLVLLAGTAFCGFEIKRIRSRINRVKAKTFYHLEPQEP